MDAPKSPGPSAPQHLCSSATRSLGSPNAHLCGIIGSGKTVIGERLAARLGRPFLDLDREADRELGRSFHEPVQEEGWLAFREREYALCWRFANLERVVVALGGGTVRYAWNTDILHGAGVMILLDADLGVLAERVRRASRPRVNPGASLAPPWRKISGGYGPRLATCTGRPRISSIERMPGRRSRRRSANSSIFSRRGE